MNNKLLKYFICAFIFLFPILNVNAYYYKNAYIRVDGMVNGTATWEITSSKTHKSTKIANGVYGFFIHQAYDSGNYIHAYCLNVGKTADTRKCNKLEEKDLTSGNTGISEDKITRLKKVLANGHYYNGNISSSTGTEYSGSDKYKILATQILVWEIVEGARTSFSSYAPNVYNSSNSAYNIFVKKNSTIYKEYKAIIDKINKYESGASISGTVFSEGVQNLPWNGKKYTKTFKIGSYTSCKSSSSAVSVSVNKNNHTATVSSNTEINSAVTISCSYTAGSTRSDYKYYKFTCAGNYQDLIRGETQYVYKENFKVKTDKKKVKIVKYDSKGKQITGAKFTLSCAPGSSCGLSKPINIDLTTSSTQTIELSKTARYLLTETVVPVGKKGISPTEITIDIERGTASVAQPNGPVRVVNGNTITINIINDENTANILINKIGNNGEKLEGVSFYLLDSTKTKKLKSVMTSAGNYTYSTDQNSGTESYTTNANGNIKIINVPPGTYYFQEYDTGETGYPVPEGNEAYTKINIEITQNGIRVNGSSSNEITISNAKNEFCFYKVDENGNYLTGGKFKIQKYNKSKNKYDDLTIKKLESTDNKYDTYKIDLTSDIYTFKVNNGVTCFKDVESSSKYRIVELEAPEGYEISSITGEDRIVVDIDSFGYTKTSTTMINKSITKGIDAEARAELIVNIQTGQNRIRYAIIISVLVTIIIGLFILKKKRK